MRPYDFVVLFACVLGEDGLQKCNWAQSYTDFEALASTERLQVEVMNLASESEGKFASDGYGVDSNSGLTYSTVLIDLSTGLPIANTDAKSSYFEEALHMAILAQALTGLHYAKSFFSASMQNTSGSVEGFVIDQLERKMSVYDEYLQNVPAMCGVFCGEMFHLPGPKFRCSAFNSTIYAQHLDHVGWAMIATGQALVEYDDDGKKDQRLLELAGKYFNYAKQLATGILIAFYNRWRNELISTSMFQPPMTECVETNFVKGVGCAGGNCELRSDYDESLAYFVYLYADWTLFGGDNGRAVYWTTRQKPLTKVVLNTVDGNITVQQGYYYGAWERIGYLYLPYLQIPVTERLFINGERARLYFSAMEVYPGLFTRTECNGGPNNDQYMFYEALGIEPLSSEHVETYDIVAPAAAFPALLHESTRPNGLAWYVGMLQGSKMQGPLGASDAFRTDVNNVISPLLSWRGKVPPIIAFGDGVGSLVAEHLRTIGKFEDFEAAIVAAYAPVFTELEGENIKLVLPLAITTSTGTRFNTCNDDVYTVATDNYVRTSVSSYITEIPDTESTNNWLYIGIGGGVILVGILIVIVMAVIVIVQRKRLQSDLQTAMDNQARAPAYSGGPRNAPAVGPYADVNRETR